MPDDSVVRDELEVALTRTLAEAADAAPPRQPGLVDAVEARFRARRRRVHSVVAGVAAFAVIGGSALAVGMWESGSKSTLPPSTATELRVPAAKGAVKKPPIAEVWPEAYYTLASKLEDGRKFHPVSLFGDDKMLVTVDASFENASELWVIDLSTRNAQRLVELPEPEKNPKMYASDFTVGSDHVVWWEAYQEGDETFTRIWKARLEGGEPQLVTTVRGLFGGALDKLTVAGDSIYFSSHRSGGIHQVPLDGGEAKLVEGTEGYHIVSWPWIGTPGEWDANGMKCTNTDDKEVCEPTAVGAQVRVYAELWNLETDERRTVSLPDPNLEDVTCGVTYCYGRQDMKTVVFTRDGRDQKVLVEEGMVKYRGMPPALDRFVTTFGRADHDVLHDLKTGKQANLVYYSQLEDEIQKGAIVVTGYRHLQDRLLVFEIEESESYAILDLGAIK